MNDLILHVIVITTIFITLVQLIIMLIANCIIIKHTDKVLVSRWLAISIMAALITLTLLNQGIIHILIANLPFIRVTQ